MSVRMTEWLVLGAMVGAVVTVAVVSARAQNPPPFSISVESSKLQLSREMWLQNDNCGKESFQKFPDYTAEGAANRDAYMRGCLRNHHLAPRNDLAQPLKPGQ
jgi:hypothetical protein